MDTFFDRKNLIVTQKPHRFLASLQFVGSILSWIAGFVQLTEEEQREAGIYLGE